MHGKKLIVDCMYSFGGIPLDVNESPVSTSLIISSSNKCIQVYRDSDSSRLPFGIKILQRSGTPSSRHLRPMGKSMEKDTWCNGALHFTDTHVVQAKQALTELIEEGGEARYQCYCENHRICVWKGMCALDSKYLLSR